ncbi:T-cell ecto-ADP-ribosyltransferase 2-like isoform X3 [Tachysurus fulvidraco]|uniref:T-cell ecto-ADP-ribosyltransferase 2-like isoform X3 n=1 Tax=Tachysurus fulvidraco TaxID=1234273 RepID=UPI001FED5CAA|nr:T-cell ecto-ADP-ribosyltransferase 2-like isoform X3 [Tachysurus fulvidraco]
MKQAVFILVIIVIINTGAVLSNRKKTSALKLDMASDSVDDQFIDCTEETDKLINKVLKNELNTNEDFKKIWNKYPDINDHITRIIKVYTDPWGFHSKFNDAVSSGKNYYPKTFNYTAFHFLLTRAVQMYKVENCVNVFRRTHVSFKRPKINATMRFGRFASTSGNKTMNKIFGTKSCFQINTCFGANISEFSVKPEEDEVLVPPFEMFNITKITDKQNHMNCEVLYTLKSAKTFSNMNCELLKKLY